MANETAQHMVLLGIPELLEAILLNLDQKDLLVSARRVCRQWRQCIAETPSIQQHLFLLPEPRSNTAATTTNAGALPAPRQNPLLARHFPEWFEHGETWSVGQRLPFGPGIPPLPWITRRLKAYAHPRASWRRMLLQQPPRNGLGFVMTRCARAVMRDALSHAVLGDICGGALAVDRPITMSELFEVTNMLVPARPATRPGDGSEAHTAANGDLQPLPQELKFAMTRFRVMWWCLSPEVRPSGEVGPDEVYQALRQAMNKYGIVVQLDTCPHYMTGADFLVIGLRVLYGAA
ncbi:uncharacterized protein PG986_008991 [Apiospora aurea]|uniref:F-box domain-containing protein n=1 Tax=Apiospora aurea TaxID=335848 RepID=A0ABR1Q6C2_9PEZI